MGLNNQLTEFSSDSLPIFLLATIADAVCYLRSLIFTFLYSLNIIQHDDINININTNGGNSSSLFDVVGTGLAELVLLADQLNINRVFSYKQKNMLCDYNLDSTMSCDCVVCLNTLSDGQHVRKLSCGHVFHKECFDGWLEVLNFKCPLCRAPLVSDERVEFTRRRVADDVIDWFAFR